MLRIESAGASDRGHRRCDNQDRYFTGDGCFAVADGVGGRAGGDVAAQLTMDVMCCLARRPSGFDLSSAVRAANTEVHYFSRETPELRGLATTITAVQVLESGSAHVVRVANVGDSRLYLIRDGGLSQLTIDDAEITTLSVGGTVRRRRVLTRALGLEPTIEVPTEVHSLVEGDRLILCTDGVTDELSEEELLDAAGGEWSAQQQVAEDIVRAAVNAGGRDNATAVVIDVVGGPDPRPCRSFQRRAA